MAHIEIVNHPTSPAHKMGFSAQRAKNLRQETWPQSLLCDQDKCESITPMGKPPPLAVRLAKALPFQRAQGEMRCMLTAHDYRHTANGDPTRASVVSGHTPKQGRRHDPYATAAGGFQGLQALSPHRWPPLGAFIKLPAERVVHDFVATQEHPQLCLRTSANLIARHPDLEKAAAVIMAERMNREDNNDAQ